MKKILIISDIGHKVGLGHYSRSKIINKEIKFYFKKKFIIKNVYFNHDKNKNSFFNFSSCNKILALEKIIKKMKADCIFLNNSRIFEKKYGLKMIKFLINLNTTKSINSVDSYLKYHKYLNYVWIPNIIIQKEYKGIKNILYGWDKILINKNKKINKKKKGNNTIITQGGSDVFKLTKKLPILLKRYLNKKIKVHWLVGPYSPKPKKVKKFSIKVLENKKDIKFYNNYNSGFVLFGISFFELLYNRVPISVFIPQRKEKKELILKLKKESLNVFSNLIDAVIFLNKINLNKKIYQKKFNNLSKKISFKNRKNLYKKLFFNNSINL